MKMKSLQQKVTFSSHACNQYLIINSEVTTTNYRTGEFAINTLGLYEKVTITNI